MKLILSVDLPDELCTEITSAARECGLTRSIFAAQAIESVLASRRLPNVPGAKQGPRFGTAAASVEPEQGEENCAALGPLDIPTADDLDCLENVV